MRQGEIWLTNFEPAKGTEMKKVRPAVILQNNMGNLFSPITIVAPLTTQKTEKVYPFEVLLSQTTQGIDKTSKIALNHLRSIDKTRVLKKLGQVHTSIMPKIDDALRNVLSLH